MRRISDSVIRPQRRDGAIRFAIAPCQLSTILRSAEKYYVENMTTAENIEKAVEQLAPASLCGFALPAVSQIAMAQTYVRII